MTYDPNQPERPRVEPEIIPPDRSGRGSDWPQTPWRGGFYTDTRGAHRIYVGRIDPFGFALLILAIAALIAVIMIAIVGALLIWIPVIAVLVFAAAIFRVLRR